MAMGLIRSGSATTRLTRKPAGTLMRASDCWGEEGSAARSGRARRRARRKYSKRDMEAPSLPVGQPARLSLSEVDKRAACPTGSHQLAHRRLVDQVLRPAGRIDDEGLRRVDPQVMIQGREHLAELHRTVA